MSADQKNAPTGPGAMLKKARETSGVSLQHISEQTLIPVARLSALEAEDFERVGGSAYVVGYARNAAQTIGVDPKPIVDGFAALLNQGESRILSADEPVKSAVNRPAQKLQGLIIAVGAALLAVILLLGYLLLSEPDGKQVRLEPSAEQPSSDVEARDQTVEGSAFESVQSTSEDADSDSESIAEQYSSPNSSPASEVTVEEPDVSDTSTPLAELYAEEEADTQAQSLSEPELDIAIAATEDDMVASGTIDIYFSGECWIQITDAGGERLAARVAQAGDHLQVSGTPPFDVMLGNARAAAIDFNGAEFPFTPRKNKRTLRLTLGE